MREGQAHWGWGHAEKLGDCNPFHQFFSKNFSKRMSERGDSHPVFLADCDRGFLLGTRYNP